MSATVDMQTTPSLNDVGFTGGRDNFKDFCKRIFSQSEPRFLKTDTDQLVVFRHADLQAFGTAPEIGSLPIAKMFPVSGTANQGERPPGWEVAKVISSQVFTFNPPLHGPARRILTTWLGPKQIALMEATARKTAQTIIDKIKDGDEIDFVSTISERMTTGFWSTLLRLTADEANAIAACAHEMTRLFHLPRSPEDIDELDKAFSRYAKLLDVAAERCLEQGDPAMTEIAQKLKGLSFEDDPFEVGIAPKTLGEMLSGNLVEGYHTAALASANTFYALMRNPEALSQIKTSPGLVGNAIAEALRLEPPVIFLRRYALKDFHYRNLVIPAGSMITMLWAAGNHDPSVFPDPDRYDLSRPHAGLTTFGTGIHICPGRYAGVMLVRVLLETFAANGIELGHTEQRASWFPNHMLSQLRVMPVRIRKHVT